MDMESSSNQDNSNDLEIGSETFNEELTSRNSASYLFTLSEPVLDSLDDIHRVLVTSCAPTDQVIQENSIREKTVSTSPETVSEREEPLDAQAFVKSESEKNVESDSKWKDRDFFAEQIMEQNKMLLDLNSKCEGFFASERDFPISSPPPPLSEISDVSTENSSEINVSVSACTPQRAPQTHEGIFFETTYVSPNKEGSVLHFSSSKAVDDCKEDAAEEKEEENEEEDEEEDEAAEEEEEESDVSRSRGALKTITEESTLKATSDLDNSKELTENVSASMLTEPGSGILESCDKIPESESKEEDEDSIGIERTFSHERFVVNSVESLRDVIKGNCKVVKRLSNNETIDCLKGVSLESALKYIHQNSKSKGSVFRVTRKARGGEEEEEEEEKEEQKVSVLFLNRIGYADKESKDKQNNLTANAVLKECSFPPIYNGDAQVQMAAEGKTLKVNKLAGLPVSDITSLKQFIPPRGLEESLKLQDSAKEGGDHQEKTAKQEGMTELDLNGVPELAKKQDEEIMPPATEEAPTTEKRDEESCAEVPVPDEDLKKALASPTSESSLFAQARSVDSLFGCPSDSRLISRFKHLRFDAADMHRPVRNAEEELRFSNPFQKVFRRAAITDLNQLYEFMDELPVEENIDELAEPLPRNFVRDPIEKIQSMDREIRMKYTAATLEGTAMLNWLTGYFTRAKERLQHSDSGSSSEEIFAFVEA